MISPRGWITPTLLVLTLACIGPQSASAYPDRPVRIIVPYAPGGGNDTLARLLGRKLEELWRRPVIIENKAGEIQSSQPKLSRDWSPTATPFSW